MLYRRTPAIRDSHRQIAPHSIAALESWRIHGVDQGVLIRGQDRRKPVVLFLHGGPGNGQIGTATRYQQAWESDAVLVNWDQRGAGLSYASGLSPATLTIEQILADALVVIQTLLQRFGRKRLTLVGHSWGSILGMKLAQRHPELVQAYIGVGQITTIQAAEQAGYDWVLETARAQGHARAVHELESIGRPPYASRAAMGITGRWIGTFAGGPRVRLQPSTEYTLWDRWRQRKGSALSMAALWDEIMAVDLPAEVPAVTVPVTFCLGRHDWTTPSPLAAEYLDRLQAPAKRGIWFERAGHSALWEEPDTFAAVLTHSLYGGLRSPGTGSGR